MDFVAESLKLVQIRSQRRSPIVFFQFLHPPPLDLPNTVLVFSDSSWTAERKAVASSSSRFGAFFFAQVFIYFYTLKSNANFPRFFDVSIFVVQRNCGFFWTKISLFSYARAKLLRLHSGQDCTQRDLSNFYWASLRNELNNNQINIDCTAVFGYLGRIFHRGSICSH